MTIKPNVQTVKFFILKMTNNEGRRIELINVILINIVSNIIYHLFLVVNKFVDLNLKVVWNLLFDESSKYLWKYSLCFI